MPNLLAVKMNICLCQAVAAGIEILCCDFAVVQFLENDVAPKFLKILVSSPPFLISRSPGIVPMQSTGRA
jgi:hypothetical protein